MYVHNNIYLVRNEITKALSLSGRKPASPVIFIYVCIHFNINPSHFNSISRL